FHDAKANSYRNSSAPLWHYFARCCMSRNDNPKRKRMSFVGLGEHDHEFSLRSSGHLRGWLSQEQTSLCVSKNYSYWLRQIWLCMNFGGAQFLGVKLLFMY